MKFRNFDADRFLQNHWQKSPALIRNPWQFWNNLVTPDELAGFAYEDDVEARLVEKSSGIWHLEHGPLPEERFARLGASPWTLLVQAVDHFVPEVAALIEPFRFIPNWRIDDVMVSYASDGGGVGPHFDQYDVFLVQGVGRRRWQIGQRCDEASALLPHDDLRLLADFRVVEEWVLEPGDILYVPPGVAHNGVAVGDHCMTYSIGFRAPSRSELIAYFCDYVLDGLQDDERYSDPELRVQENPGEIAPDDLARMYAMATESLSDPATFATWFGKYATTSKYDEADWRPETTLMPSTLEDELALGQVLTRNSASRFSFIRSGEGSVQLFVDGESYPCKPEMRVFAERLCAQEKVELTAEEVANDALMTLVTTLFNRGALEFGEAD